MQGRLALSALPEGKLSGAALSRSYAASGHSDPKKIGTSEMWRHYTTRGHSGPVTCVRANTNGSIVVTGSVDFSMRVWCENMVFEAYECIAIVNVPLPPTITVPRPTFLAGLRGMIIPPTVDWAAEPKQGVTSVHPLCDVDLEKGTYRNGPILCGTGHGSLHAVDLSVDSEDRMAMTLGGVHDGAINDICALKFHEEGTSVEFWVMTAGEDGVSKLLRLTTAAVPRPNFFPSEQHVSDNTLLDCMFFGGGGRREHDAQMAQEKDIQEETWLRLVDLKCERVFDHTQMPKRYPVLECHALAPHPSNLDRIAFITLTSEGLFLRNTEGEEKMFLRISMEAAKRYVEATFVEEGFDERPVDCQEHVSMATTFSVRKVGRKSDRTFREQAMVFLTGFEMVPDPLKPGELTKQGRVASWCLRDGILGVNQEHGVSFDAEHLGESSAAHKASSQKRAAESAMDVRPTDLEPLCIYEQEGFDLDIDKSGYSTSFATQLRNDRTTVDMWMLEAVPEHKLVVAPDGPQNLLLCPGSETTELQMSHCGPVLAMQVIDTGKDSVLISGCEDGCAYMWDLGGADRGQIFAEARSLGAFELIYPPLNVIITAFQLFKFAFRPPSGDGTDDTKMATEMHHVALLKYFNFDCSRETLFLPELMVVCGFMAVFLLIALLGLDEFMDRVVARAYDLPMYKAERLSFAPAHLLVKLLSSVRNFTYLVMQLGSTVLVVPIVQIIAGAAHCSESADYGGLVVSNAPHIQCLQHKHLQILAVLGALVPLYLFLLMPFAVVAGDALYVPSESMFEWRFWQEGHPWKKAAARKATTVHQAVWHLNPRYAFMTLLVELIGKIMMPIIATVAKSIPLLQMALIVTTNLGMWVSTMVYAPYVDRKFSVLLQDTRLTVFCASVAGLLTVAMNDEASKVPIIALSVLVGITCLVLVVQLFLIPSSKPKARVFECGQPQGATLAKEEVAPLLGSQAEERPGASE